LRREEASVREEESRRSWAARNCAEDEVEGVGEEGGGGCRGGWEEG
jgi:hypothetical protein